MRQHNRQKSSISQRSGTSQSNPSRSSSLRKIPAGGSGSRGHAAMPIPEGKVNSSEGSSADQVQVDASPSLARSLDAVTEDE